MLFRSRAQLHLGGHRQRISLNPPVAPPVECAGYYCNGPLEYLVTEGHDGDLYLANGDELIARFSFSPDSSADPVFVLQDLTTGRGAHEGRFVRDPVTRQIEQLQIGGRLARRYEPAGVPEARSPAESTSRRISA